VRLIDFDAEPPQLRDDVAPGPLAVVGQEQERDPPLAQLVDEPIGAGDELAPPVDHPIHVDEEAVGGGGSRGG
jgi:hypothetical protein